MSHTADTHGNPEGKDDIDVDFADIFAKALESHDKGHHFPGSDGLAEGAEANTKFKLNYYAEAALKVLTTALAGTRAQGFEFTEAYLQRIARVCAMHIVHFYLPARWGALRKEFGTDNEEDILHVQRGREVYCSKPVDRSDIMRTLNDAILQLGHIQDEQFQQVAPSLYTYQPEEDPTALPQLQMRDELHKVLYTTDYRIGPQLTDLKGAPQYKEDRTEIDCSYDALLAAMSRGDRLEMQSTESAGDLMPLAAQVRWSPIGKPDIELKIGTSTVSERGSFPTLHINGWGSNEVTLYEGQEPQKMTLDQVAERWKFYKRDWTN